MGRIFNSNKQSITTSRNNNAEPSQAIGVYSGDSSRLVLLNGDVNEQSISMVVAQLLHLAGQNHKPIHLVISTYGGSVDEMFTLYDTIKFLPCPVNTIALGKVMSAGVLLLAAGTKGKRMIGASARIMLHPIAGGAEGNVFEVISESKEQKRIQKQLVTAFIKETNISKSKIDRIMGIGHNVYMMPSEAIALGIVDKIIGEV